MARAYQWDPREKMVRLMSCLRGPALTAHRSLPHGERDNYDSCIDLLRKRCGHDRPIAKTTLRADLSAIRQEEGESLDTFADRVYALTVEAYPNMERGNLLDSLAVPALRKGIRDRSAAQETLKLSNPSTTRAAVETVLHVQCAARTLGVRDRCPVCRSDTRSTRQVSSVPLGHAEYETGVQCAARTRGVRDRCPVCRSDTWSTQHVCQTGCFRTRAHCHLV